MKYGKASIITPKHTAFVWNNSNHNMIIPDEYSSNIKHIYLANDFTCILNLANDAVCINDSTNQIVFQMRNVSKIICEELFVCYLITDENYFTCKAFEAKYDEIIPVFQQDYKMDSLEIKLYKNFKFVDSSNGNIKSKIFKRYNAYGNNFLPDLNDQSQGEFEYYKIIYCILSLNIETECMINLVINNCINCNYSLKIDFGQSIYAQELIISNESICLKDDSYWHCYTFIIYNKLKIFNLQTAISIKKYNIYPSKLYKSFINRLFELNEDNSFSMPNGVQHNTPLSYFDDWKILYKADWNAILTTADIDKEVDGEVLFVGTYKESSDKFYIGAYGTRQDILNRTLSNDKADKKDNNVYWYFKEGKAFGFSDIQRITLYNSIFDTIGRNSNNNKLSWCLGGSGGGRAGAANYSAIPHVWYKVIFYKPFVRENQSSIDDYSAEILDSVQDGDSYCVLSVVFELSCYNFPNPFQNLYYDSVKQSTDKQIKEYIDYYKLKKDDSQKDDLNLENLPKEDLNEQIQKLNEEIHNLKLYSDDSSKTNQLKYYLFLIIVLMMILLVTIIWYKFYYNKPARITQVMLYTSSTNRSIY